MSKLESQILKKAKLIIGELPPYATRGDMLAAISRRIRFNDEDGKEILRKLKS
jgi:hypothetical protein